MEDAVCERTIHRVANAIVARCGGRVSVSMTMVVIMRVVRITMHFIASFVPSDGRSFDVVGP
jgi:hypothetical protein